MLLLLLLRLVLRTGLHWLLQIVLGLVLFSVNFFAVAAKLRRLQILLLMLMLLHFLLWELYRSAQILRRRESRSLQTFLWSILIPGFIERLLLLLLLLMLHLLLLQLLLARPDARGTFLDLLMWSLAAVQQSGDVHPVREEVFFDFFHQQRRQEVNDVVCVLLRHLLLLCLSQVVPQHHTLPRDLRQTHRFSVPVFLIIVGLLLLFRFLQFLQKQLTLFLPLQLFQFLLLLVFLCYQFLGNGCLLVQLFLFLIFGLLLFQQLLLLLEQHSLLFVQILLQKQLEPLFTLNFCRLLLCKHVIVVVISLHPLLLLHQQRRVNGLTPEENLLQHDLEVLVAFAQLVFHLFL